MAIYDNSPDIDIGFKATLSFVLAIAAFGFGTLVSLALETPVGILFAITAGLLLAIIPFIAGWIDRSPIGEDLQRVMDMGNFSDEAPRTGGEAGRIPPRPPSPPPGEEPAQRHP